jgi:hypothetical protein
METNTSLISENYVWGEPEKTPDNTGYLRTLCFWAAVFICIAAACFYWPETLLAVRPASSPGADDGYNGWAVWGFFELCVVLPFLVVAFSNHLRVDGIEASESGMSVAYSHIPEFAGDYINERVFVHWRDVSSIEKDADGEGAHWVGITLISPLATGDTLLKLSCTSEADATLVSKKLLGIAGHMLMEPKT